MGNWTVQQTYDSFYYSIHPSSLNDLHYYSSEIVQQRAYNEDPLDLYHFEADPNGEWVGVMHTYGWNNSQEFIFVRKSEIKIHEDYCRAPKPYHYEYSCFVRVPPTERSVFLSNPVRNRTEIEDLIESYPRYRMSVHSMPVVRVHCTAIIRNAMWGWDVNSEENDPSDLEWDTQEGDVLIHAKRYDETNEEIIKRATSFFHYPLGHHSKCDSIGTYASNCDCDYESTVIGEIVSTEPPTPGVEVMAKPLMSQREKDCLLSLLDALSEQRHLPVKYSMGKYPRTNEIALADLDGKLRFVGSMTLFDNQAEFMQHFGEFCDAIHYAFHSETQDRWTAAQVREVTEPHMEAIQATFQVIHDNLLRTVTRQESESTHA